MYKAHINAGLAVAMCLSLKLALHETWVMLVARLPKSTALRGRGGGTGSSGRRGGETRETATKAGGCGESEEAEEGLAEGVCV